NRAPVSGGYLRPAPGKSLWMYSSLDSLTDPDSLPPRRCWRFSKGQRIEIPQRTKEGEKERRAAPARDQHGGVVVGARGRGRCAGAWVVRRWGRWGGG